MMAQNNAWTYGAWKAVDGIDAIIEQGVTDGWHWRKFANGNADCWRRVSQTIDITTQWGGFYYGNCVDVSFPLEFAAIPIVNATLESSYSLILGCRGTTSTTAPAGMRAFRIGTEQVGANIVVAYHAIGRWK